ncbi:MAG: 4-hydroxy-tetrahydrodipicolinate synthase [Thermoplasmata archaeon]
MVTFEGIIPPMLTPFKKNSAIDLQRLREFVDYLIEGGVHGLFPSASSGEFSTMTIEERKKVIETVIDQNEGRLKVVPGTGSSSIKEAIELSGFVKDEGGDGVIIVTPYYLKPDQKGLIDFYGEIAGSIDLPIILYELPSATGVKFEAETVSELADEHDNIVGLKDSSGDFELVMSILDKTDESFNLLQGIDSLLLPSLMMGCTGGVPGSSNIRPEFAVKVYELYNENKLKEARQVQKELLSPLSRFSKSAGVFPAGYKASSKEIGMNLGKPRKPIRDLTIPEYDELSDKLRKLMKKKLEMYFENL